MPMEEPRSFGTLDSFGHEVLTDKDRGAGNFDWQPPSETKDQTQNAPALDPIMFVVIVVVVAPIVLEAWLLGLR
jgi:hypothetical protein